MLKLARYPFLLFFEEVKGNGMSIMELQQLLPLVHETVDYQCLGPLSCLCLVAPRGQRLPQMVPDLQDALRGEL
jgi:hypothetical protein